MASETYTEREDALRAQGNVLYGDVAAGGGRNAADKRSKLQRAQELYEEALDLSCSSEKRASCCESLGALHYLWSKVELDLIPSWNEPEAVGRNGYAGGRSSAVPPSKLAPCNQHLSKAMSYFLRAHVEGARAQKPCKWMQQVASSLTGLVKWAAEQSRVLAIPGAPILEHVCETLKNLGRNNLAFKGEAEALANLELAEYCLFQHFETCGQTWIWGVPAAGDKPLSRARSLLEGLPPSATTGILRNRVESLQSDEVFQNVYH